MEGCVITTAQKIKCDPTLQRLTLGEMDTSASSWGVTLGRTSASQSVGDGWGVGGVLVSMALAVIPSHGLQAV